MPGTHAICCPFEEVPFGYGCLYFGCLYFGSPHIVADGVAHTGKGDRNALLLQRSDEAKQSVEGAALLQIRAASEMVSPKPRSHEPRTNVRAM